MCRGVNMVYISVKGLTVDMIVTFARFFNVPLHADLFKLKLYWATTELIQTLIFTIFVKKMCLRVWTLECQVHSIYCSLSNLIPPLARFLSHNPNIQTANVKTSRTQYTMGQSYVLTLLKILHIAELLPLLRNVKSLRQTIPNSIFFVWLFGLRKNSNINIKNNGKHFSLVFW